MNASPKEFAQTLLDARPDSLLRQALAHWPGVVLAFDALLRVLWCSAAAQAQVRGAGASLEGRGIEDLEWPWPLQPEDFDAALDGRSVELDAAALAARDGRAHAVTVRLHPLALGDATGVLCCVEPATAAALAIESLPRDPAFAAAQAGGWRWDFERRESVIDPEWCAQLGLDPCIGADHEARWEHQVHPDDVELYRRRRAEVQRGSIARFEVEYRMLTMANSWVWILQRGRVVRRDAAGRPLEVRGLCIDIDRRKREETTLRANESRLATALWGARAAFWQWHVPTDVLTLSPMWFAMTGYTREQWESVANPWDSRAHPEDIAAVHAAVQRYQRGETDALEYEYRMRTGSGEWKWLLDRARAVEWDPDGRPAVVMGVTLDIDAQKRAEIALRSSQARLKTAVWGARMGLWELDFATERTVWFNDWCAQNDIEPCDGSDHVDRWDANIHPDDVTEAARRFSEHVEGRTPYYDAEYRVRTVHGRWLWVFERSLVVERDAAGHARRMVGICMDITARREQELRQHFSQPWLEAALEVGRGGMWSWDVDARTLELTDTYFRMLGFEPREGRARTRFWVRQVHREDRRRVREGLAALVDGHGDTLDVEYRMRRRDGEWIWVHDRARVHSRGPDGRARQVVGFVVDVSEAYAAREALRASEERFRTAALAVRGVIYDSDLVHGVVHRFGAESVVGYGEPGMPMTREQFLARVHPEDRPRVLASRAQVGKAGEVMALDYRLRHADGHWMHVSDRSIFVCGADGRPLRRIGFLEDISVRQREREALAAQAQVLAALDVGVALLDDALAVEITNAAFDARFGAPASGLIGRPLRELLAVDAAQWQRICDEMAAADAMADSTIELTCRRCDGTVFQCQARVRALLIGGERRIILALQSAGGAATP